MSSQVNNSPDQGDFMNCYRGRQSNLHHAAYMRMSKVLLALEICSRAGIVLRNKKVFDYGFGAGTFYRYCDPSCQLSGVEMDPENIQAVSGMLKERGFESVDLQKIEIENWSAHPLLKEQFDVILCSHVLEHLPDPAGFLGTIGNCLGTDSVFVGLVPVNELRMDPHHVQVVNRAKVEAWAMESGLQVREYLEADPFLYWLQPVYASNKGIMRLLAQAFSLGLGIPATLLGPRRWFALGRWFGMLTGSRPTQAAFILMRP